MRFCYNCGCERVELKKGDYRFTPPFPDWDVIVATDTTWQECDNCGYALLSPDCNAKIEQEAARIRASLEQAAEDQAEANLNRQY